MLGGVLWGSLLPLGWLLALPPGQPWVTAALSSLTEGWGKWEGQGLRQPRAAGRAPGVQVSVGCQPPSPPLRCHRALSPLWQQQRVLCSYQLGSGEANIRSEDPIDDGEWHRVTAVRSVQQRGERRCVVPPGGGGGRARSNGGNQAGRRGAWGPGPGEWVALSAPFLMLAPLAQRLDGED